MCLNWVNCFYCLVVASVHRIEPLTGDLSRMPIHLQICDEIYFKRISNFKKKNLSVIIYLKKWGLTSALRISTRDSDLEIAPRPRPFGEIIIFLESESHCFPVVSWEPNPSSHLSLPQCWNYRPEPSHPAGEIIKIVVTTLPPL